MRVSTQTAIRLKEAGFPQPKYRKMDDGGYVLPTEFYYGDYSGDCSGIWAPLWIGNGIAELFKDNSCETLVSAPDEGELLRELPGDYLVQLVKNDARGSSELYVAHMHRSEMHFNACSVEALAELYVEWKSKLST